MNKKQKMISNEKRDYSSLVFFTLWAVAFIGLFILLVITLKTETSVKKALAPILLGAALIAGVFFLRKPIAGIYMLVALMPILAATFLNTRVINLAGMKLDVILPAVVMVCLYINKCPSNIGKSEKNFILAVLFFYFIAYARSLSFALPFLSMDMAVTPAIFLRSYMLNGLLYFIPFILICTYLNERIQIHYLIRSLFASAFFLGVFITFIFMRYIRPLGDYATSKGYYVLFYDAHPNDIANFFLLSIPIFLAYAFYQKKFIYFLVIGVTAVGILLCFSRSVYALAAVVTILFLLWEKKVSLMFASGALVASIIPFLPKAIQQYAMTLITGGNLNTITSGRTDEIWGPLVAEMSRYSLSQLLFGFGRYGIFNTSAFKSEEMALVSHAHNAYLTTVLDIGIIGLIVFLFFFAACLVSFFKASTKTNDPFYKALLRGVMLSLMIYLVRGISGGLFLPDLSNMFLWVILGIGILIVKLSTAKGCGMYVESKPTTQVDL